jgi:hypothetical protein
MTVNKCFWYLRVNVPKVGKVRIRLCVAFHVATKLNMNSFISSMFEASELFLIMCWKNANLIFLPNSLNKCKWSLSVIYLHCVCSTLCDNSE